LIRAELNNATRQDHPIHADLTMPPCTSKLTLCWEGISF
jgi:hypothetical protein